MSVFVRMGSQIVLDVALYPGDTIRILILYGIRNKDLELQMAKSLLAHLDWMNWKVQKSLEVVYQLCFKLTIKKF